MYNFENINTAYYYGGQIQSSGAISQNYANRLTMDNVSSTSKNTISNGMVYSNEVHQRLLGSLIVLLLSGALSLISVVFEVPYLGVVGAFLLTISFFLLSSWVNMASDEKTKLN